MRLVESEERIIHLIHELPVPLAKKLLEFLEALSPESNRNNGQEKLKRFAAAMGAWRNVDTMEIYSDLRATWKTWMPSA
jgi:hypothetical protein